MAWEWSQTDKAYSNAYENLHDISREILCEILAEWVIHTGLLGTNEGTFYTIKRWLLCDTYLNRENIADAIWKFASSWEFGRTCDNGGFNARVCPHGCHTVPFDREDTDNE